jgi:hypothetical protein
VSLKETIEGQLKIPTRIRLGTPGSLDVFLDGQKVYSKKEAGDLSTHDIVGLVRAQM